MESRPADKPLFTENDPVRVLLLEDDVYSLLYLEGCLTRAGIVRESAAGVEAALQAVLLHSCDVVVLGPHITSRDGLGFVREAKRVCPWMGIVVCAADPQEDFVERAEACGANRVLLAPYKLEDLIQVVKDVAVHCRVRFDESSVTVPKRVEQQLALLSKVTDAALNQHSLRHALECLAAGLFSLVDGEIIAVLALDSGEDWVLHLHANTPQSPALLECLQDEILRRHDKLSGTTIPRDRVRMVVLGEAADGDEVPVEHLIIVPVMARRRLLGLICLANRMPLQLNRIQTGFLHQAAAHLSTLLLALNHMRYLAVRDPLTACYNRRHMDVELPRLWKASGGEAGSLGLFLLDVDYFKDINDTLGHACGDRTLVEFHEILKRNLRGTDMIFRLGGDEFLVLLPQTPADVAEGLVERIHETLRTHMFMAETHNLRLTVSSGLSVADSQSNTITHHQLLERADKALYVSKRKGRDQYTLWEKHVVSEEFAEMESPNHGEGEAIVLKGRVLVVDDEPLLLQVLERSLTSAGFEVKCASSVSEGELILRQSKKRFDILITDLSMPDKDGFEMLTLAKEVDPSMVRIMATGHVTAENAISALRCGAYDFMQKPFSRQHLLALMHRALEYRRLLLENHEYQHYLERMVRQKSAELARKLDELRDAYDFSLDAMVAMLDAWELETSRHSQRVMELTGLLAARLGITDPLLSQILRGALLHDIGKIGVPNQILRKPGPLNEAEWKLMRKHPEIGHRFIQSCSFLGAAMDVVLCHHEFYDGSGYPRGLKGEAIPLGARIFSVVDAYDAMRSPRVYKASMPVDQACAEIQHQSGCQFDPKVVAAFQEILPDVEAVGRWETILFKPDKELFGPLSESTPLSKHWYPAL